MVEMILWAVALTVSGLALSAAVFAALTVDERRARAPELDRRLANDTRQRFFVAPSPTAAARKPFDVPVEVLLLRLEQHIRLEQAAAESFHLAPTAESLHTRTTSPLVVH